MDELKTFEFHVPFVKGYEDASDKSFILEGIASTTDVDLQNERVSLKCLSSLGEQIQQKGINLFFDHDHKVENIAGRILDSNASEDGKLSIRAKVANTEKGKVLKQLMQDGCKLGLSVGGKLRKASQSFDEVTQKHVTNIEDVNLLEVSVVGIPANPHTNVTRFIAKSLDGWVYKGKLGSKGERKRFGREMQRVHGMMGGYEAHARKIGLSKKRRIKKAFELLDVEKLSRRKEPLHPQHRSSETGIVKKRIIKAFSLLDTEKGEKFERCVRKVKAKGGAVNPYAVCRASMFKKAVGLIY